MVAHFNHKKLQYLIRKVNSHQIGVFTPLQSSDDMLKVVARLQKIMHRLAISIMITHTNYIKLLR
jgi:hypothetical protein